MHRSLSKYILFGVAIVAGSTAGCHSPPNEAADGPPSTASGDALTRVTPITPQRKSIVRRVEQPGHVEAFQSSPLHAKVSGYVQRLNVDIGDRVQGPKYAGEELVEPGQVLAVLAVPEMIEERKQREALIEQAKAEVKQAVAAIAVAQAARGSAIADVGEAKAGVDRAEANFQRWQSELNRMTELVATRSVTAKLEEETRNQHRAADAARSEVKAQIESAEARLLESESHIEKAKADHEAAQAKLKVAEAELARVQTMLDYATIRAPFDGIVTSRNIDVGHLISATTTKPLFEVIQAGVVRVFVDVPEADAVFIEKGNEASIRVPSLGGEAFTGQIARTSWILDDGTRTLRAEIDVPNDQGQLRPGMYVYADVKVAERQDAIILPQSALMHADGKVFCWQIDGQSKVLRTPLATGISSGGEVEIIDGLTGSEKVVGVNPTSFREGQLVEVAAPPSTNPPQIGATK